MKVFLLSCFFTILVTCSADSSSLEYDNGQNLPYNYNEYKNENIGREGNSKNHLLNSNNYNHVPNNIGREGNNNNNLRNLREGMEFQLDNGNLPTLSTAPLNDAVDNYLVVASSSPGGNTPTKFETRHGYAPPGYGGYSGFGGGAGAGISGGIGISAGIGGSIGASAGAHGYGYGHGYGGYGR